MAVIQIIVLAVIALAVNILAVSHGVGWVKGSYYERESDQRMEAGPLWVEL